MRKVAPSSPMPSCWVSWKFWKDTVAETQDWEHLKGLLNISIAEHSIIYRETLISDENGPQGF